MRRSLFVLLLVMILVIGTGVAAAQTRVGVAMPTQSLQRWNQDGAYMKQMLEEAGYVVDLQYANNDVGLQVSQLETMILNGADILVIASIDGSALGTVLEIAQDMGIPVIAYDRLIMETDAVTYYATFDNYMVGTIQGQYLVDALGLETLEGSVNIEITGGSPDDNNARYFYQGAYDAIEPYIKAGKVIIPSGQVEFEQIATLAWSSERAQARMDNLIAAHYSDGTPLHAVLCSNDSTAIGVTNALINAGFDDDEFPLITGQDCDIANVKNIIAGRQAMSIFKDTRMLAAQVVKMIEAIVNGEEPEINDTTTYDNNVKIVPTYLCPPVFADINNFEELLIESGYYTREQLGL
ncbi:MAG: sugar ABC transporter substrate-binding protein [Firmicutes bacterium]|jgi:putative multiple sugar transport system substrate-binding protein|nr:sugar ABC transporter substrate-binding protein [Bacillota bacterium]NLO66140.1 sugar ABC transporter substrate-binding protein [Bacillota bacterium]